MIANYPSDRQFYEWHLLYLDPILLLSNLTWRRAHVTAGWLAGISMQTFSGVFVEDKKLYSNLHIWRLLFTCRKKNLDSCSAFGIRLLVYQYK